MTAQTLIQRVTDTLYAPFRYSGAGIPEGVQVSEPGWIYRDTNNGLLWYKKTGSAATGWKAMGGTLALDTTATGNVGSGEDTLQSMTIPAGMLKDNGDSIKIQVAGANAANGNTKTLKVRVGGVSGTVVLSRNINTSGEEWTCSVLIVRTAGATGKCVVALQLQSGTVYVEYTALTNDWTAAVDVVVTGEATSDNDILKQIFQAELLPAP